MWSNSDKSWDKNSQKRAGENKGKNSKRPILQSLNWSTGDGGIGHLKILLNNQIHWKHGGLSSTTWCFDGFLDYPWYIKYTLWLSTTDITCSLLLSVLEDCRKINWRPTKQTVIGWSFFCLSDITTSLQKLPKIWQDNYLICQLVVFMKRFKQTSFSWWEPLCLCYLAGTQEGRKFQKKIVISLIFQNTNENVWIKK